MIIHAHYLALTCPKPKFRPTFICLSHDVSDKQGPALGSPAIEYGSSIHNGTKEFIKGVPEFVVAIALAERGVPVLGATYNPVKGELFWGGLGCHQDGASVCVTPPRGWLTPRCSPTAAKPGVGVGRRTKGWSRYTLWAV
jgi:Inositol monophosphatase family